MGKKALTPVNESTLAENIIKWETILSKLEKYSGKKYLIAGLNHST